MSAPLEGRIEQVRACLVTIDDFLDELLAAAKPAVISPPTPTAVGLQQPHVFYDYIRGDAGELFPVMREMQYHGVEETLRQCAGKMPASWTAYVLATEYHETGRRMQAVREGFDVSDAWRKKNLRYYPWYGRGEVQLTWERNYAFATKRLNALGINCDLVADPDSALDPVISTAVMVYGMLEGWFTGKKLRDYIPATPTMANFKNARRIINGTDKDELIAGYAWEFYTGLIKGDWK